jgi:aminoglycoside/choline kinase family phosphotransferase
MPVKEDMGEVLSGRPHPGLAELRHTLGELLVKIGSPAHLTDEQKLGRAVYRLRFKANGEALSFVAKCLEPEVAQRNQFVAERWLPAVGLGKAGPPLVAIASDRQGRCVWHIYEDLGDWGLEERNPDADRFAAAVELLARLHARFVGHPCLGACRLLGGDLGVHFFASSVSDAISSLDGLRPPCVQLSSDRSALRDRLLNRLGKLSDELEERMGAIKEMGGPETLLHGDLWPKNALVIPTGNGLHVRLIDWDHAGVGPLAYDLSTFLSRVPVGLRRWVLDIYLKAPEKPEWAEPSVAALNFLFETAECARLAHCVIWQAIAAWETGIDWAFENLAEIDEWFESLAPLLPS